MEATSTQDADIEQPTYDDDFTSNDKVSLKPLRFNGISKKKLLLGVFVLGMVLVTIVVGISFSLKGSETEQMNIGKGKEANNSVIATDNSSVDTSGKGTDGTDIAGTEDKTGTDSTDIVGTEDKGSIGTQSVPEKNSEPKKIPVPFPFHLPAFDESSLLGYSESVGRTCNDLRYDLTEAVKQYINTKIAQDLYDADGVGYDDIFNTDDYFDDDSFNFTDDPESDTYDDYTPIDDDNYNQSDNDDGFNVNDISTVSASTREDFARSDESGKVITGGNFVYTTYGNTLLVWNVETGEEIDRVVMPKREESDLINDDTNDDSIEGTTLDVEEGGRYGDRSLSQRMNRKRNVPAPRRRASIPYPEGYYGDDVNIRKLLLDPESNRLGVIVSGYETGLHHDSNAFEKILEGQNDTQFFLYDTSSLSSVGTLRLIGTTFFRGYYQDARIVGSSAFVSTISFVDMFSFMGTYLLRYDFETIDNPAYIDKSIEVAKSKLESVVDALFNEITTVRPDGSVDCSEVSKIGQFISNNNQDDVHDLQIAEYVLDTFGQVNGVDMSGVENSDGKLISVSSAGTFFPEGAGVHATNSIIFFSTGGYTYNPETSSYVESTYILGFSISSNSIRVVPKSFGHVNGHLANSNSINKHGDYLRVATTIRGNWDASHTETNFWGSPTWSWISLSSSQITIFMLPSDNDSLLTVMSQAGFVDTSEGIGLVVDEHIAGATFVGNTGFVFTDQAEDPFYMFDLSNPADPKFSGGLNVLGFSSYLHSIKDDNTLILSVGHEIDNDSGLVVGAQISLFDISDMTNPVMLHRYVAKHSDQKSAEIFYYINEFQYLPESKNLVIPFTIEDSGSNDIANSFDGFAVYSIDEANGISPSTEISHLDTSSNQCWDSSLLPTHCLDFGDKVVSTKGHTVMSTDLISNEELWTYNVDKDFINGDTCLNWWRGPY
mmetsp:Transcript_33698/g.66579  ORF Transcript_33698/g.66579 Transcript_33698/m.66579 type:complete len:943 (+) Transcript_33698:216-3044(+)|eukprot:CAMPEP_0194327918 /NCGR_PEP_ID=MMETSP0171-20130528/42947_1 /TAXON_ID=218684 /ORGANISM="Corethron pennatum, Strain L29A3" /LENGTH=942 /DNA_ID=CAMNT_0039088031 /DNA_START=102 /DNA_END=2930 /DNA_ORIENTATION=+